MSLTLIQNDTLTQCSENMLIGCGGAPLATSWLNRIAKQSQTTTPLPKAIRTLAAPQISTGVMFEIDESEFAGYTIPSGDWIVELNKTSFLSSNIVIQDIYICHFDSSCVSQAQLGTSHPNQQLTGGPQVFSFMVTGVNGVSLSTGDKIVITCTIRSAISGTANALIKPDSNIITPAVLATGQGPLVNRSAQLGSLVGGVLTR